MVMSPNPELFLWFLSVFNGTYPLEASVREFDENSGLACEYNLQNAPNRRYEIRR